MAGLIAFLATPAGQASLTLGGLAIGWLLRHKGYSPVPLKPADPASPAPADPLAGLPGLPGHPLLNALMHSYNGKVAQQQQLTVAQVLAELAQLAQTPPTTPLIVNPPVTPLGRPA